MTTFSCSPTASIRAEGGTIQLDGEAILSSGLVEDEEDPRFSMKLLATLSDEPRAKEFQAAVDRMTGLDEDTFPSGRHFRATPGRDEPPDEGSEVLSLLLHAEDDPECRAPFGYATFKSSFRPDEAVDADDVADPGLWRLHFHPDAVFVDAKHRRKGYGLWLGEAMFVAAELALFSLAKEGAAAEAPPRVDIDVYFEIYAEGGERAVQVFNSGLEVLVDILPEIGEEDASCAIEIADLVFDGGW